MASIYDEAMSASAKATKAAREAAADAQSVLIRIAEEEGALRAQLETARSAHSVGLEAARRATK